MNNSSIISIIAALILSLGGIITALITKGDKLHPIIVGTIILSITAILITIIILSTTKL